MTKSNISGISISRGPDANLAKRDVVCLSTPRSQPNQHTYYDLVGLDHFWAARRFDVVRKIAGSLLASQRSFCEIGCGTGILQRQLEVSAGLEVDGIDICLEALERNQSKRGTLYCYDVLEQHPSLREKYDLLFLCDVVEHIQNDEAFLRAALFHLKPGGYILINVPARPELYSAYDEEAGHLRRYNRTSFLELLNRAGLRASTYTYWGLPLYPALVVRKFVVSRVSGNKYEAGFRPMRPWINAMMRAVSNLEPIPQRLMGISLLALAQKSAAL